MKKAFELPKKMSCGGAGEPQGPRPPTYLLRAFFPHTRNKQANLIRQMLKALSALGNSHFARVDARALSRIFTSKAKRLGIKL